YLADVLQPLPKDDAPPAEVKIDPHVFDAYAGEYAIDNNGQSVVMMFGRRDEHFFLQPAGQPPVEIFPMSETEFFMKVTPGRVACVRERDGTVNRVMLHRARGDLSGQRIVAAVVSTQSLNGLSGAYYSEELDAELSLAVLDGRLIVSNSSGARTPLVQRS